MFHFSFPVTVEAEGSSPQLRSNPIKCNLIAGQARVRQEFQQQINQNKKAWPDMDLAGSQLKPPGLGFSSSASQKPRLSRDFGASWIRSREEEDPKFSSLLAEPLGYSNLWDTRTFGILFPIFCPQIREFPMETPSSFPRK